MVTSPGLASMVKLSILFRSCFSKLPFGDLDRRFGDESGFAFTDDKNGIANGKTGGEVFVVRQDRASIACREEGGNDVYFALSTDLAHAFQTLKVVGGLTVQLIEPG